MTVLTAASIFRDYITDGVPSSGIQKPVKADVRTWGTFLEGNAKFPEAYGAVRDGSTNDAAALQAAIDAAGDLGVVRLAPGNYAFSGPLTAPYNGIVIDGAGKQATTLKWTPTADNQVAITFSKGAAVNYRPRLSNLTICSADTTNTKTAIGLSDVSAAIVENILVCGFSGGTPQGFFSGGGGGNGSIGIIFFGRELGRCSNLEIAADSPLFLSLNPNTSSITSDSFNFHNMYLLANGHPVVDVASAAAVFNAIFSGAQNWIGGTDGFRFIDTSGAIASINLHFENLKLEQGTDATAYAFNIQSNTSLYGCDINGAQFGDRRGFFFRNVRHPKLANVNFLSNLLALDVDSSALTLQIDNCFWQNGSTANLSGLNPVFVAPRPSSTGALPPFGVWTNSASPATVAQLLVAASTTTAASLNLASGSAPTSPNNGDMWFDGTNLKFRVGGVTKTVTLT